MAPLPRSFSDDLAAALPRAFAYMGGAALLAIAAASFFAPSLSAVTVEAPLQPVWAEIHHANPAFELAWPDRGAPTRYAVLRRDTDRARKDLMVWGGAGRAESTMMVELLRAGTGETFIDAPSEIATRLTDQTIVDDVKDAGELASKFGPLALVDFAIAAHGALQRCLGFTRAFATPHMQIAGWTCNPGDEVVDRAVVACALDQLTMLSSGGDANIAALFARAELKRGFCGARNPIIATTPEQAATAATAATDIFNGSDKLRGAIRG